MIAFQSAHAMFKHTCGQLIESGFPVPGVGAAGSPGAGRGTHDLRPHAMVLADPRDRSVASASKPQSYPFVIGAFIYILSGRDDVSMIEYYNPRAGQFSDDGLTLRGSYGPVVQRCLPEIIELLVDDPWTRRAVLPIFSVRSLAPSKDVPCPIAAQLICGNGGRLDMLATFRSQSIGLLPYDVALFTLLQEHIAAQAGLPLGHYMQSTGSMHVYDDERHGFAAVAREPHAAAKPWPAMTKICHNDWRTLLDIEGDLRQMVESYGTGQKSLLAKLARTLRLFDPYWSGICNVLMRFAAAKADGVPHLRGPEVISGAFDDAGASEGTS